jgi:hypothetical protein
VNKDSVISAEWAIIRVGQSAKKKEWLVSEGLEEKAKPMHLAPFTSARFGDSSEDR